MNHSTLAALRHIFEAAGVDFIGETGVDISQNRAPRRYGLPADWNDRFAAAMGSPSIVAVSMAGAARIEYAGYIQRREACQTRRLPRYGAASMRSPPGRVSEW